MKVLVTLAAVAVLMSGCAMNNEQSGRAAGGIAGAGLGALLGNALDCKGCALIGGVLGGLAGGAIGGNVGASMDRQDQARMNRAIHTSPTGQTTTWQNPDTNMQYSVQPTRTYQGPNAQPCREVVIGESKIGGEVKEVYGTACYDGAGGWKMK